MDDRERAARWSDQYVEQIIGTLLRAGLALATALVAAGGVVYLVRHGHEAPHYGWFHGVPEPLRRIGGIVEMAHDLFGRGFIQLGLLVLLATPVARVAFSVLAFVKQRDPLYVGVTVFVLAVLLASILGGYWR